jgi:cell shape-determining protein MreC
VKNYKPETLALCALIVLVLILIVFTPSYGWKIRQLLTPGPGAPAANDASLTAENEVLKAEVVKLQGIAAEVSRKPANYLSAIVYSRYPLNFKNELLVDAGTNEGVKVGSAAVFQGIFVGVVEQTFADTALVQTIFDNNLKIPVRIGTHGYDGLLQGGASPTVKSIAQSAAVLKGDIIYTAGPGVPYALPIGEVTATSTSADSLFQEASIAVTYNVDDIENISLAP